MESTCSIPLTFDGLQDVASSKADELKNLCTPCLVSYSNELMLTLVCELYVTGCLCMGPSGEGIRRLLCRISSASFRDSRERYRSRNGAAVDQAYNATGFIWRFIKI